METLHFDHTAHSMRPLGVVIIKTGKYDLRLRADCLRLLADLSYTINDERDLTDDQIRQIATEAYNLHAGRLGVDHNRQQLRQQRKRDAYTGLLWLVMGLASVMGVVLYIISML